MSEKEIENNIDTLGNQPTIGYHLFHNILPFLLLQPGGDSEVQKKNFFSPLDNQEALPLKHLFLGLCKTAAEIAQGRKYDLASEQDNMELAETPGFLLLYFSLQIYSIVELKDKTRIYIWKLPAPSAITEPHYIAIVLLSEKHKDLGVMIRYFTLESSIDIPMLCEWTGAGREKCHVNYGDCENDKDIFLDRILKMLDKNHESIESITDYSLIEDRHNNN